MLKTFLPRLVPNLGQVSRTERLRASLGALLGIVVTGAVTQMLLGSASDIPLLIAPIGASAVLLFAVPSSPLAQPWSILGGNISAALIGVTCRIGIDDPILAASLAVCLAIGAMFLLRCLHPPSGAVAVTAAVATPSIQELGYGFVLAPVALNSALLLVAALVFNNLTRHRYPHLRPVNNASAGSNSASSAAGPTVGFTLADLDAVLKNQDEVIDIDRDDLAALLHAAEMQAYRRRSGDLTCADIMSRNVKAVSPTDTLQQAWKILSDYHIKALPVIDLNRKVTGVITQTDFMKVIGTGSSRLSFRFGGRLESGIRTGFSAKVQVRTIMTSPAKCAAPETTIPELVPLMARAGLHHMPVTDASGVLVGIVTQSDLIAALFQGILLKEPQEKQAA